VSDVELLANLEEMGGSPAMARALKKNLDLLAGGAAGPELAEMAREVIEGRTDLRGMGASGVYAEQLTGAIHRFQRWHAELSPEEREQIVDGAREQLASDD
jgi:hypothetical protein